MAENGKKHFFLKWRYDFDLVIATELTSNHSIHFAVLNDRKKIYNS